MSERTAGLLRWGLVPFWAKDISNGSRKINARAETVREKPSFRRSFKSRRCLIPVDGWFEWPSQQGGKQPYFLTAADEGPLSFAGLWDSWDEADQRLETFKIITTEACSELSEIQSPAAGNYPAVRLRLLAGFRRLRRIFCCSSFALLLEGPFRYAGGSANG